MVGMETGPEKGELQNTVMTMWSLKILLQMNVQNEALSHEAHLMA